jgi:lactate dehydrogenase-like 2-hydroxyacid dehydrogenase
VHHHLVLKVLVLSPLPEGLIRMLFAEQLDKYKVQANFVTINEPDVQVLKRELSDADVVIGDYSFKVPITAEMVGAMNKVKVIAQPSTGYDHIDLAACKAKGIPVCNIGGANAISVAEHALALALMLLKRLDYAHQRIMQGVWAQEELLNVASEVHGKTWGIIGLGRIGREVSARAVAMGARVVYTDVARLRPAEEEKLKVSYLPLARLLAESDVVSIHVPLTTSTRKMIGEREFRLMKSYSMFVNVSRGELVDEAALAKAVSEGWIGGAGVDVFSREPISTDHPLLAAAKQGANLVLTPHIAGATNDARMRIIQVTVENVMRVVLGQQPANVVNP